MLTVSAATIADFHSTAVPRQAVSRVLDWWRLRSHLRIIVTHGSALHVGMAAKKNGGSN